MKTNYLLLAAITALPLGMTGCSQSEDVAESTSSKQTITFVSGDETPNQAKTRTSMGGVYTDASFPFYWEKGDAIWVNAATKITGNNTTTAAHATFTGTVTTADSYKIRYTGTGSYNTNNSSTGVTLNTTSDANTLVMPPVQTLTESGLGSTANFGAIGDCGTATATGSQSPYDFKLDHKAAYLILMPRWPDNTSENYKLKSVIVTTHRGDYLISGRFSFSDDGIGSPISGTNGSATIKVTTGSSDGVTLPTSTNQDTKSINIVIKPVTAAIPLYCIYEVYDTNTNNTYYICKIISGKSFPENTITPITANLESGYQHASDNGYLDLITNNSSKTYNYPNIYYNYVQWDAPVGEAFFVGHEKGDSYNSTTTSSDPENETTNVASASCKDCVTYKQLEMYLGAGVYFDADKVWGPGSEQKGGIWLKKKATIAGFDTGTAPTVRGVNKNQTPNLVVTTKPDDLLTNWFFLPNTGLYFYDANNSLVNYGSYGYYWLSVPGQYGAADFCFSTNSGIETIPQYASCDNSNGFGKAGCGLWKCQ